MWASGSLQVRGAKQDVSDTLPDLGEWQSVPEPRLQELALMGECCKGARLRDVE